MMPPLAGPSILDCYWPALQWPFERPVVVRVEEVLEEFATPDGKRHVCILTVRRPNPLDEAPDSQEIHEIFGSPPNLVTAAVFMRPDGGGWRWRAGPLTGVRTHSGGERNFRTASGPARARG
jgi:hypothetical protein